MKAVCHLSQLYAAAATVLCLHLMCLTDLWVCTTEAVPLLHAWRMQAQASLHG